ncbi:MAG: CPBP family intramembrane metalloprotease [Clostridiales bacterium]|nr:CPBP family intramembrane metalloprotease [Clostridiales bacterium]
MLDKQAIKELTKNSEDRKVFKLGLIVFISTLGLQITRLILGLVNFNLPALYLDQLATLMIQFFFLGVLPVVLYKIMISRKHSDLLEDASLRAKVPPKILVASAVLGFALAGFSIIPSLISSLFFNSVGYQRSLGSGTLYTSDWILLSDIIFIAVFPAIFEEFVDRGILLGALKNVKSEMMQVIIAGIYFGVAHQNVPQFLPATVAGMIIAYVAILTRSIWPGVIIHFCNNFAVVILSYMNQKITLSRPMQYIAENSGGLLLGDLVWPILAGVIIFFVLRFILSSMAKYTAPKVSAFNPEQGHYTLSTETKSYTIYGMDPEKALHSPSELLKLHNIIEHIVEDSGVAIKKVKVSLWAYAPIISSFVTASFITLATLFWGMR